jgi:hypothetical protein
MKSLPNQDQIQTLNSNDLLHLRKKEGGEGLRHPDSEGPTTSLPTVDISGLDEAALATLPLPCYVI